MAESVPKADWRRHRFDEMAVMVNDRVDDPAEAGVEYYVGLEHLDSDSLKIRRWGSPSDVEATKLRFRAGDIIFGRRRVYQRKLAIADFDGICSAHAMVLRAKQDVVLSEFLPFFMQSDLFMERAKEISVGSLSPTINWKTLAKEEFALPPLDEQRRIAEAFSATLALKDQMVATIKTGNGLRRATMARFFERSKHGWPVRPIGDVLKVVAGGTPSRSTPSYWGGDIPWVKTGEVDFKVIAETEEHITSEGLEASAAKMLPAGSVLVALYGQGPTRGRVAMLGIDAASNQACAALLPAPMFNPWFVHYYLEGKYEVLRAMAQGAAQPNLNLAMIKTFPIPVPSLSEQGEIVRLIAAVSQSLGAITERRDALHDAVARLREEAVR